MSSIVVASILGIWFLQGTLMFVDEFKYHHKRGLGLWERVGHPVDTLFFLAPFVYTQFFMGIEMFVLLCAMSCLIVTKDEFVHSAECEPAEHWLHSVLFILHPVALFGLWFLWQNGLNQIILLQSIVIGLFMLYQIIYWNFLRVSPRPQLGVPHEASSK